MNTPKTAKMPAAAGGISRPLAGVRILELGRLFAAPFATQVLADFGAEVIKVEIPGRGDEFRHYAPRMVKDAEGRESPESANYLSVNRNKRSITVDMQKPEGQAIIRDLAATVDVVVENFKAGGLKKYGLDYESITETNPEVIYLSISGFGQDGPYAPRRATDAIFQAMSGLMSLTGEPDGPPQRIGVVISDKIAGLYAASAILMALRAREVFGAGGQHIDVALMDAAVATVAPRAHEYFLTGEVPMRLGSRAKGSAPSQLFECADGLLQMQATTEADFRILCEVLDLPDLVADPRFKSRMDRYDNVDALAELLTAKFRNRTVKEWYDQLVDAGVSAAPIYNIDQTFADPQVIHRGLRVDLERPGLDNVTVVANPIRFAGKAVESYAPPPTLGQHTREVLTQTLGMSPDKVAELREKGVI